MTQKCEMVWPIMEQAILWSAMLGAQKTRVNGSGRQTVGIVQKASSQAIRGSEGTRHFDWSRSAATPELSATLTLELFPISPSLGHNRQCAKRTASLVANLKGKRFVGHSKRGGYNQHGYRRVRGRRLRCGLRRKYSTDLFVIGRQQLSERIIRRKVP